MRFASLATLIGGILAGAILLGAGPAAAIAQNPECILDARDDFLACKVVCREAYRVEKDLCRNIDHDCADACRAGHQTCVEPPLTALAACKAACNATLAGEKQNCRDLYEPETPERDQCIDAAQVIAFQCRDTCREGVRAEIRLCRQVLRACARACPPAAE